MNIIVLWYLAGLYLVFLGVSLLLDSGGIFVGFLWVIDLGVGLIFFIFILHFSNFLYQKSNIHLSHRIFLFLFFFLLFLLFFFFFLSNPADLGFNRALKKSWFFFITFYDYYELYYNRVLSDLNLIREIYFYNNAFSFFIINFMLFYGIFSAINLSFLLKRVFNFLNFVEIKNFGLLEEAHSSYFIRNQNFIKQQNTSTGARVWNKHKNFSI